MTTDLNFTQWLRKYFHDGEMRIVYKSKYDGKEYDLDYLEKKYRQARGLKYPSEVDAEIIAARKSAVGKIKTDEPTDLSTK